MTQKTIEIFKKQYQIPSKENLEKVKLTNIIINKIKESLKEKALTVPEISAYTKLPMPEIFWHINALRKYGKVEISHKEGNYLKYSLVKEA